MRASYNAPTPKKPNPISAVPLPFVQLPIAPLDSGSAAENVDPDVQSCDSD